MQEPAIIHHLTTDLGVIQNTTTSMFQRLFIENAVNHMQMEVSLGLITEASPRNTTLFVFETDNLTIKYCDLGDEIDEQYRNLVIFTFQVDDNKWSTFNFYMKPDALREAVANMADRDAEMAVALESEDVNENG